MRTLALAALLVAPASLASCGGSAKTNSSDRAASPRSAEAVIRAWSDALRIGKIDQAAGYFALPSVVENGTAPIKLRTRAEAREFNIALPCGAKLLRTATAGRFTTAVFRLTDRPGPGGGCSGGIGGTARTTFVIVGGRIKEWRRVSDRSARPGAVA